MIVSPDVIAAAKAAQAATRVPASVSIGQYALESGWGKHMPPGSNNPFGVKGFHDPDPVWAETTEVIGGVAKRVSQPFRRYASIAEAFLEHAQLLANAPVYAAAMAALPDLTAFVRAMAVHYATDPQYGQKLLGLIHIDGLEQYDGTQA